MKTAGKVMFLLANTIACDGGPTPSNPVEQSTRSVLDASANAQLAAGTAIKLGGINYGGSIGLYDPRKETEGERYIKIVPDHNIINPCFDKPVGGVNVVLPANRQLITLEEGEDDGGKIVFEHTASGLLQAAEPGAIAELIQSTVDSREVRVAARLGGGHEINGIVTAINCENRSGDYKIVIPTMPERFNNRAGYIRIQLRSKGNSAAEFMTIVDYRGVRVYPYENIPNEVAEDYKLELAAGSYEYLIQHREQVWSDPLQEWTGDFEIRPGTKTEVTLR